MSISVVLSGLPGSMTAEALRAIRGQNDMYVVPLALTGPREKERHYEGIELVHPAEHKSCLQSLRAAYPNTVAVDFSRARMDEQARIYAGAEIPFVYGGTVGNKTAAKAVVKSSTVSAVIAPNMSKQLVAWTAALEYLAREFPGAFANHHGHVRESHQRTKADPSGTGLAWMHLFGDLGVEFDGMESIRERPEGHAYHWMDIKSRDNSVRAGFYTQVDGRQTYADGTIDAIRYLDRKMKQGSVGVVFSMVDVLRNR